MKSPHKHNKQRLVRRLKIIEGQVRGLEKMLEDDVYCVDVITQSLAVKQALSSFEHFMLENHLSTHVVDQMRRGQKSKAIKEILSVYKLVKR